MSEKIDVEIMQTIFVGGQSRSGTTLLQGLLCNSDATIETTAECSYFRHLIQAYAATMEGPLRLHAEDYFNDESEKIDVTRKIITPYFVHLRNRFGDKIPVQKEPQMMGYFPELALLMTNAVFVATFRDPRDVFTSQSLRLQKRGETEISYRAWEQSELARLLRMLQGKAILKDRMFFVRYESLCANPQKCLAELNNHLNKRDYKLKLHKMKDFSWQNKRNDQYETVSELDGKEASTKSIGNYKDVLPNDVLDIMMTQLNPFLKEKTGFEWFCADDMDNIDKYPAVIPLS